MSAVVVRAALDAAAAHFAANVTGMSATGKVAPISRDAFRDTPQPSIALVPGKRRFEWGNPTPLTVLSGQRGLWRAGTLTQPVQIRVVARTAKEREPIEQEVEDRFGPRRGTLHLATAALTLSGVATGYTAPVTLKLGGAGWDEEKTNERRRYSFLDTTLTTEILYVSATGTLPTMATIALHVTHDMTALWEVDDTDPDAPVVQPVNPSTPHRDYLITADGPELVP